MRIILQDTKSGWYYQGCGTWTPDAAGAFDFQFSAGLPEFSDKLDLLDVQLLVQPDGPFARRELSAVSCSPQP